ncbi:MAG: polyprenyl synthetase family protein [Clostridia bacterium]|nr:polyprenyl synthetase family protein [Clostridia bacterium]
MQEILERYKSIFSKQLNDYLKKERCDIQPIFDAVKYGIENGGKRIRPALCYMASDFCGKDEDFVASTAVGIEMIHSYSLIHDDLPCMDNDSLRRGKPTLHVVYGEGMAVLSGDALLNMAFETMLTDNNFDENALKSVRYIAKNSGINGMIGGQCIDLSNEDKSDYSLDEVMRLNRLKTSCLLKSALVGSLIKCGGTSNEILDMENFATKLGEIFQIVDDILDKTSSSEVLGKETNQDRANGKKTVVDILGLEESRKYIAKLEASAISDISKYGARADKLIALCKYLTQRLY